jgi:hypothetical protein
LETLEFSDEFCRFIQTTIPAVAAAELLLLYRSYPEAVLTIEEAVARLGPGIDVDEAARHVRILESQGLLARQDSGYRYRSDSNLAPLADMLDSAYARRPVTLIRIIYAFRDSNIKSFADAFKLRK